MASVSTSPPGITLQWAAGTVASNYFIHRRVVTDTTWSAPMAILPGSAITFVDASAQVGVAYEYKVVRIASQIGYGYVRSGISLPPVEQRGKLVLLVEAVLGSALEEELVQLKADLEGDGWLVITHSVSAASDPVDVRSLVMADHAADPDRVKAVFILGHVPVPYSGNIYPDGHLEHMGAWPCDGYYGDVDGTWTDSVVSNITANFTRNHNVPGDGKFDQSDLPSTVELQVGRVDLSQLDVFSQTEEQLTRAYLAKAHAWKTAQMTVPEQGSVWDDLTWVGTPLAFSGFASIAPCVGGSALTELNVQQEGSFWPHYQTTDELFTFQCSTGLLGVGLSGTTFIGTASGLNTSQLVTNEHGGVFNMSVGSYYGDWDNPDNFLRSVLASGNGLVHVWSGIPNWYLHPLAMGEPIGYCALRTMNNTPEDLQPQNGGWQPTPFGRTHLGLMGDPSLRMRYIAPPTDVVATNDLWFARFNWTASPQAVDGYHIYRIDEANDTIVRITPAPVQGTTYTSDSVFVPGARYMVRAIDLVTTPSGTYYDLSLGAQAIAQGEQVLDCVGVLGGAAIPGTACDDDNALTFDEVFDTLCICLSPGVSVPEFEHGSSVVWPSPASDVVNIPVYGHTGAATLEVFDATGRMVMSERVTSQNSIITLNTAALHSGVYSARLRTSDGAGAARTFQVAR